MQWHESDIDSNGIRIHVYRSGGDGPPLVLLHGATDNGLCWPRVADALASDYEIIALDARGHGKSDKPQTGYSGDDHVRDVAGVIEALGLDKPIVAGHSMGAYTTSLLAATYPDLVSAVILEDPPFRLRDPDFSSVEQAEIRKQHILARKSMSLEEIERLGKEENPQWAQVEFQHWAEAKLQVNENISSGLVTRGYNWHEITDLIRCPALLLIADPGLGAITTAETAKDIAKVNPNIVVRQIADAGHNIRRDQFGAYLAAVQDFLAGL